MKSIAFTQFYDTLLCIPGMHDVVKVDLRMSRKSILVFSQLLEQGLQKEQRSENEELSHLIGPEVIKEIQEVLTHCLEKSQLSALSNQLQVLQKSKAV